MSFSSFSQYYNLDPIIKDSISSNSYMYHVSGIANFNDSLVLHVELLTNEENPNTVFAGEYNFSTLFELNISEFTYSPSTSDFSFKIGEFSDDNLKLHMWITKGDLIENEIHY